jgi:hypothetical protein
MTSLNVFFFFNWWFIFLRQYIELVLPSECIWIFICTSDKPLINRHFFNNYHRYYMESGSSKKEKSSCGCGVDGWLGVCRCLSSSAPTHANTYQSP